MNTTKRYLSVLAAWAFSFGTAVGWGAFVMPGMAFLPKAGPWGTVFGVMAGAVVMLVIAWNYHYMIRRMPGAGGTFSFVSREFGGDHGFFCAWFLCLSYVAILWANATSLTILARCLFGDALRFGFRYSVKGFEVSLGDILLSAAAILAGAAVCCRKRLAGRVQTAFAVAFFMGIVICFAACLFVHKGGLQSMAPAFSPDGGEPLAQSLKIVALAPWLFVGFESVCHLSGEVRFPLRRMFGVMAASIAVSAVAYSFLVLTPALAPAVGDGSWVDGLARMSSAKGAPVIPTLDAARSAMGNAGLAIFVATIFGAVFTNLVGNMIVASRLVGALADADVFPEWVGRRDGDGNPRNAIIFLAAVSCLIPLLGRTAIGFIVDVATVGSVIAYAYTSAAAFKAARASGHGFTAVSGLCGFLLSAVICALFIVPNYFSGTMMATESYLILVLWSILGFLYYLYVLKQDRLQRYGGSLVVWVALIVLILVMSHMWMRQGMHDAMTRAFDSISDFHDDVEDAGAARRSEQWNAHLAGQLDGVSDSLVRGGFIQASLMAVTLAIMFSLFTILRRRERRLEKEKTMAKSYFFSTVSHDVRTPLNAIIGYTEMLKAGMDTKAERDQALDSILVSGRTLLGLINDVLDISRLESGRMKINEEPTDCQRLMHAVLAAFRVSNRKPGVELRYLERPMPALMLDPQRIRQIVFNLVGNAVKFTEKGYVELRASYEPDGPAGGEFRIDVEDTGCGIGEEDLKRIGAAYVQVDARHARNGGTGLGLAICKQLAVAMGGQLKVKSALGKGSTFSIVIRGVKVAKSLPARPVAATEEPRSVAVSDGTKTVPPAPRRLLLVDDSKMNLMVLKALLKKQGDFEVVTANDGQEALDILKNPGVKPFDMVLTDMWMPNLDGEGLVKAIRATPDLAALPVLVVTADVEIRDKSSEFGFDGILLKPVTTDTLGKALSSCAAAR